MLTSEDVTNALNSLGYRVESVSYFINYEYRFYCEIFMLGLYAGSYDDGDGNIQINGHPFEYGDTVLVRDNRR
jgi:hypothetical protein